jgi:membrane-bound metal-dependent hydrolase YbcI (DUF457 family)
MVERTLYWLTKRRNLRTRWSKKAETWLALIQLACAHVLLDLAVFGRVQEWPCVDTRHVTKNTEEGGPDGG